MFRKSSHDRGTEPAPSSKAEPKQSSSQPPPASGRPEPRTTAINYVDRPDCQETFADTVQSVVFDGQMLRIEFAITRFDEIRSSLPATGRRYPAARVVLPPSAAVDLINKMQQIATGLAQAGLLKQTAPGQED